MGKNILVIGVGGTGSTAVDLMFQKQEELGNQAGNTVIEKQSGSVNVGGISALVYVNDALLDQ